MRSCDDMADGSRSDASDSSPRGTKRHRGEEMATPMTALPGTKRVPMQTPSPSSSAPSPSSQISPTQTRQIWMRSCNHCGMQLHVRRVRCTGCGQTQMGKKAWAAQQEEKKRAEALGIDALDADVPSPSKATRVTRDAQAAASQLALIASPNKPETAGEAEAAGEEADSVDVASRVARLSPEQLLKLQRMTKLRALLARLPPDVKLASARAASTASAADPIAMLASVACRT